MKKETPTYYIDKTFAKYVDFPVGSWWVYKDTISGQIDSVKMILNSKSIAKASHPFENYEILATQYIIFNNFNRDTILSNSHANRFNPTAFFYNESILKYAIMDFTRLYYPFTIGNGSGIQGGPTITKIDSSLSIGGTNYRNVVTFVYDASFKGNSLESIKYAEGVGVIYRKFFNGKTSILINYKIK
ncbi:MAG: hypothetical protein NTX03_04765 [Bacteroidetes bacterium]|nr:hypothetical protein [Bacteroidota bacterium]